MGFWKERWERGLSSVDGSVCAECINDRGLKAFIEGMASELKCDFCGRESDSEPIAAPVDSVVEYMEECISRAYEDPVESVGWDSEDECWVIEPFSTSELLCDVLSLELPNDKDGKLFDALCDGLDAGREWVHISPYHLTPGESYASSWDEFSELVKHERRFFFHDHRSDDELLSPQKLLKRLRECCRTHGLVRSLPSGTRVYRVRNSSSGEVLSTPLQLGPPRGGSRFPTRMAPAGIAMFYGADDDETALRETWDGPGTYVTACFETTRDILVLDLTHAPRIPSIFEAVSEMAETDPRPELMFLHHFADAVSEPIDRKELPHIDYVPTQIVAEYFRSVASFDGQRLEGIKYASARRPSHACYALFAGPEQVVLSDEDVRSYHSRNERYRISEHDSAWLRLVNSSERLVAKEPADAAADKA